MEALSIDSQIRAIRPIVVDWISTIQAKPIGLSH